MFNITRQINSRLTVDPVWQSTGSTGAIKRSSNVESLAASNGVAELIYTLGVADSGWARGGARDLLKTAKVTISGQEVDFGTGSWSNAKYTAANDHNDHIHIRLSPPVLGESN